MLVISCKICLRQIKTYPQISRLLFSTTGNENTQQKKASRIAARIRKEMIWNIPNIITLSRIISSPIIGYAIIHDYKAIALGGCVLSAFSDWLDGYIAKNYNQQTIFGSFLDPLADKIFIGSLSIALAYKCLIPLPLLGIILGRDLILVAGSFYIRANEKSIQSDFFDTTHSATFTIEPSEFSKVNSAIQFLLLSVTLSNYGFGYPVIGVLEPLWWVTGVTTIGSGLEYLTGSGLKQLEK